MVNAPRDIPDLKYTILRPTISLRNPQTKNQKKVELKKLNSSFLSFVRLKIFSRWSNLPTLLDPFFRCTLISNLQKMLT